MRKDIERKAFFSRKHLASNLAGQNRSYSFLERAISHNGLPINYLVGRTDLSSPFINDDAIFSLFGKNIVDAVSESVASMDWPEPGLPIPERVARLKTIDDEIAAITVRRDELAAQLIEAGLAS